MPKIVFPYMVVAVERVEKCNFLSLDFCLKNNAIFRLTGVYRSHDINKENFVKNILSQFLQSNASLKNHLILGDFNVNTFDTDELTNEYIFNFLNAGFVPLFNQITRPNLSSSSVAEGTCIDNMFFKTQNLNHFSYSIKSPFADHYPLFAVFDIQQDKHFVPRNNRLSPTEKFLKFLLQKTRETYCRYMSLNWL